MTTDGVDRAALEAAIERRRALVNEAIPTEVPIREPRRLWEASRYLLDAGGKRLRPTVLLLMAEALAEVEPGAETYRSFPALERSTVDVLAAAVSVEIIQTFTLIHDDIMDADSYRRGVETVHEAFDLETAILAGDTLYATSFERMLETGAPPERTNRALGLLARTCTSICEGQARDVEFEGRADVSLDAYLEMIEQKTAVLYATSAALPGVLLGADNAIIDELYAFGLDFGRAFQIKDDLLDLTADTATLGKDQGSDLIEGKRTVVTIHGREQGVNVDALVDDSDVSLEAVVAELDDAGSLAFAERLAHDYVDSAKSRLGVVEASPASRLLADLAAYIVEREY